jgi:DNA-binding Lrp family transcriptional regulator
VELDRTDVEILRALQENARLSFRAIARRIGVSVPTVSARVANLVQLGIITGFHAAVDPERLKQVRVVVIARSSPAKADAVGTALANLPEVRWTVRSGGSHIVAEAVLRRADAVRLFLQKVKGIAGVLSTEVHVASKALKDAPRAVIADGVSATLDCFECGQAIEGVPVRIRLDGRVHYLCCTSCERLYRERYEKIRSRAGAPSRGLPRRAEA